MSNPFNNNQPDYSTPDPTEKQLQKAFENTGAFAAVHPDRLGQFSSMNYVNPLDLPTQLEELEELVAQADGLVSYLPRYGLTELIGVMLIVSDQLKMIRNIKARELAQYVKEHPETARQAGIK